MAKTPTRKNDSSANLGFEAIQSRTLATLRDTLLPKLLSGELSMNELNPIQVAAP